MVGIETKKAPTTPEQKKELQPFKENDGMTDLLDNKYPPADRPKGSEKVLQDLYETTGLGPDFLQRAVSMDTNFDDLVTIHTELTTLGVYLDDAFEEQFIITQSESQELLDGIASARTSSGDAEQLIKDFFSIQENETVTMDEMYTDIDNLKDSEGRNEAFDQIQDITYIQLKEKLSPDATATNPTPIDEDTIHNMSVALAGWYIGKVNTLADMEITPSQKKTMSFYKNDGGGLNRQELIDIARSGPFGPDAHDVFAAGETPGTPATTGTIATKFFGFIADIKSQNEGGSLNNRENLKDPMKFLGLLKSHVDSSKALSGDVDTDFGSELLETENYDKKVETAMKTMSTKDKKVISEMVENYAQASGGSLLDRVRGIKGTISTFTGMMKSFMADFRDTLGEVRDMFGFDKKSGIFAFLSGMDQIDASLRGSLEKHEQKILPGFKGMKLEGKDKKGNAIDTKKSFKAQGLAIEDINYEETQIKELAVFKDPRGYTKSLPRSVVRKIYKDQPEAVKSLEGPRCVADIALYHAITATKGELTPENFKKESTKYRTYDSTTGTVTYKYTELTGLLNSYKDSTYTTLTARFTTEKLTPEQVDQSLIHGLIKGPAASEFMTRQSKVGERTTEVVATTKVFTLAEMTTETVLIKNSLTLGKFGAVQESFELNTAGAKPLYEYTVDANPGFPQKQKIHIDPQTVLSLDATARKTYLSELRDTEQKKFVDQKGNHIANIINKDRDTELNGKELEYNSGTDTPTDTSDDKQFVLTDPSDTTFKVTIPGEDFYKKFFENKKQWILDKSK